MISRFARNTSGSSAIVFALAAPVLAGVAAFVVDLGWLYYNETRLQTAADAGAYAAGAVLDNTQTAKDRAVQVALANVPAAWGAVTTSGSVELGTYTPASKTFVVSAANVNAVRVTARRSAAGNNGVPLFFGRLWGRTQQDLTGVAVAVGGGRQPCVIALEPSAKNAFAISGNGSVSVPNCGIWVNSTSATALMQTGGAGFIRAKSIDVVGDFGKASHVSPSPSTGQAAAADPLAGIAEPTIPGACNYNKYTFTAPVTLPGGTVYCGTIALNANVTFGPGMHYFKGATVTTSAAVNITSTNATLYFDATSNFTSTSSGIVQLSAPTSGTYQGIAIFGSRSSSLKIFKLTGNKDYFVNGTVYLPSQRLEMYGTSDLTVTSKSGFVIARQFYYQGDSSFTMDTFGGVAPAALSLSGRVSLVE